MSGDRLLKKLSILCYILGIAGIIIAVIAMNTNFGDTLFEGYVRNYQVPPEIKIDTKVFAGINVIMSSLFTLFEGWLLGRAVKDGRNDSGHQSWNALRPYLRNTAWCPPITNRDISTAADRRKMSMKGSPDRATALQGLCPRPRTSR